MITRFLNIAAKLAYDKNTNEKTYLIAAVCIRKDGALVKSTNIKTRVPCPEAHAEFRVLRKAGYDSVLFVARVSRDGKWSMAKPCKNCQKLIKNKKVKIVYYTIGPNEYGVWRV